MYEFYIREVTDFILETDLGPLGILKLARIASELKLIANHPPLGQIGQGGGDDWFKVGTLF